MTAFASQPGWWTSRDAVNSSLGTNDYAGVNQGQLKQFTARAVDELNADLTSNGGAGPAPSNIVYGWQQDYLTNGYATNTANPDMPYKPADFEAVNVGQLKYIASLVYGQLGGAGYSGLAPSWIVQDTNTDNVAANVGQLKQVFAWDIASAPATVSGVVATASNPGEIDLSWTNPVMNNATSFVIQQSTDGGATWTTVDTLTGPTLNSYAVTGLSQGTGYQFQVLASNPLGGSSPASTPTPTNMAPVSPRYAVIDLGPNFTPVGITSQGVVGGNGPPTNNPTGASIPQVWQGGTNYYVNTNYSTGPVTGSYLVGIADSTNAAGYNLIGNGTFIGPAPDPSYNGYGPTILGAIWSGASAAPIPFVGGAEQSAWYPYTSPHAISDQGFVVGAEGEGAAYQFFSSNPTNIVWFGANGLSEGPLSVPPYTQPDSAAGASNWCGYVPASGFYPAGPIVNGMEYTDSSTFYPYGINDTNIVVGGMGANAVMTIPPGTGTSLAFTNLGPGVARALNNQLTTNVVGGVTNVVATPQIVGVDNSTNGTLWDQTMYDGTPTTNTYLAKNLNLLIPGASGTGTNVPPWHVTSVSGINNGGAIVGTATYSGTNTAIAAGSHGVMLLEVNLSCPIADTTTFPPTAGIPPDINPAHFFQANPPDPTLSGSKEPALVIFYKDAINSSFVVQPFTVDLSFSELSGVTWAQTKGPTGTGAGTLQNASHTDAQYVNPTVGGLYQFDGTLGTSSTKVRTSLILPLAGAEVKDIVASDITATDTFAAAVVARYSIFKRNSRQLNYNFFWNGGSGDYLGRSDNASSKTCVRFNSVNTTTKPGFGSVVTWFGVPVRMAKVSNFLVGYAQEKIGVLSFVAYFGRGAGTHDDASAAASYGLGWNIAAGTKSYSTDTVTMLQANFYGSDVKNTRLWPNTAAADNHVSSSVITDFDTQFCSPGFTENTSP